MNNLAIFLKNVKKVYRNEIELIIFDDANLSVRAGEIIGLFAPSGYGKSTLINLISGLDKPDSGEIWVAGRRIDTLSEKELALFRRKHVGIVFQFFNLFPTLTALENVMLPMELLGVPKVEAKEKALELLELVGIEDKANNFPAQLSGGEQQRVAIARALANDPDILLADEPTGNLDEENAVSIFNLFRKVNREKGVTIVISTHDIEHASKVVNRAVTIKNRKIIDWRR